MNLKLDRIGPGLSDRIVLGPEDKDISGLQADHSLTGWLLRIISWIWSPGCYSLENLRTINCVKKYFSDQLGGARLQRICEHYDLRNFIQKEIPRTPLLSRDIAKILTGIQDVKIADVDDLIKLSKIDGEWPAGIDPDLQEILKSSPAINSSQLNSKLFARVHSALKTAGQFASITEIDPKKISGATPTENFAQYFFDRHLADRERLSLAKENPQDSFHAFVQNFGVKIIGREMEVGMIIPAPNRQADKDHFNAGDLSLLFNDEVLELPDLADQPVSLPIAQFYRVSAKIISGKGMVSYVLVPATADSDLKSIRFYRGTSTSFSAIDSSSTMITDMEPKLGFSSFESGQVYQEALIEQLGKVPIGVGHSLGATILQYDLLENKDLEEAYFFNGPGLPQEDVQKFNERMLEKEFPSKSRRTNRTQRSKLKLFIRDADQDIYSTVGTQHLGFQAVTNKVQINYKKNFPRYMTGAGPAHVQVPDRDNPFVGAEGGYDRKKIDIELHRQIHPNRALHCISNESLRQIVGPFLAGVIRIARHIFRWMFGSRAHEQLGLQYGIYNAAGVWVTDHLRPVDRVLKSIKCALTEECFPLNSVPSIPTFTPVN